MYNAFIDLKGKVLLGKFKCIDVNIVDILLYRNIHNFLFTKKSLKEYFSIYFYDLSEDTILEFGIFCLNGRIILRGINNKGKGKLLKIYLRNLLFKGEKESQITETLDPRMSLLLYLFPKFCENDSIKNLCLNKKSNTYFDNKEPLKIERSDSYISSTSRSSVMNNGKGLLKSIKWCNSIHGISQVDTFVNCINLFRYGYIQDFCYKNGVISYVMCFRGKLIKTSLGERIAALIELNSSTYVGTKMGIHIGSIQEDPNSGNFILVNKSIRVIDYDSVTVSYLILQPLYLFIESILGKKDSDKKYLLLLQFILEKFFRTKFFKDDLQSIGIIQLYDYYRQVFEIGYSKNLDWMTKEKNIDNTGISFFSRKEKEIQGILSNLLLKNE